MDKKHPSESVEMDRWNHPVSSPYSVMDPHNNSYHPLITTGFDPTIPSAHLSSPSQTPTHPLSPLRTSKHDKTNKTNRSNQTKT